MNNYSVIIFLYILIIKWHNNFELIHDSENLAGCRAMIYDDAHLDISIRNIFIPRSFYSININNNIIAFGKSAIITLNNGDYTTSSFLTELESHSASLGMTAAYNSANRHFSFNSGITGFSITVPNSQYIFRFEYRNSYFHWHYAFSLESDEVVNFLERMK